jgi:hypothetical protein
MSVLTRSARAFGLTVLSTVFLWAAGTASSQAAGYWACSGGAWIAVGNPQHSPTTAQIVRIAF